MPPHLSSEVCNEAINVTENTGVAPPQRADAMRLFFLHKYGGIYIDLDIECLRSLDFLRHYGWVMPQVYLSTHLR